ncbi:hypothetical protein FRC01_003639 [Tulasnella sp. 417]|nr:hypothetical protein FRC01_003639 [Tulasnella sp. 417]
MLSHHLNNPNDVVIDQLTIWIRENSDVIIAEGPRWSITFELDDTEAIRDAVLWFKNHGATGRSDPPQPSTRTITVSLDIDYNVVADGFEFLSPITDLPCITKIALNNAGLAILSGPVQAIMAEGDKQIWPFPTARELHFKQPDAELHPVIQLVEKRRGESDELGAAAPLQKITFGDEFRTIKPAQPDSLLTLMDIMDEGAQVYWYGKQRLLYIIPYNRYRKSAHQPYTNPTPTSSLEVEHYSTVYGLMRSEKKTTKDVVEVAALRRHTNSLLPIQQIPPEIFFEIIAWAMHRVKRRAYYRKLRTFRIVAFSWSARIDNNPVLWSLVSACDYDQVWRMALQNSETTDIDVDCTPARVPYFARTRKVDLRPFFDKLLSNAARIRSLVIEEINLERLVLGSSAAPRLRSLHISSKDEVLPSTSLVPSLAQWAPQLQVVKIFKCSFTWPNPGLNNLESITLHSGSNELYTIQVLSLLAASPALRRFWFIGKLLTDHSGPQTQLPQVQLDALQMLDLVLENTRHPFDLLNAIVASPTESCTLCFSADSEDVILKSFQNISRYAKRVPVVGRRLSISGKKGRVWVTRGGFSMSWWKDPELGTMLTRAPVFNWVLKSIPRSWLLSVEEAELDIDEGALQELVPSVHELCPHIDHVRLAYWNRTWEALLSRQPDDSPWNFPRLNSISIFGCYEGGLLKTVRDRRQAADTKEIATGIKKLDLWVDFPMTADEREEFVGLGVTDGLLEKVGVAPKICLRFLTADARDITP